MTYALSKDTIQHAVDIKNCAQGLIAKYEDYMGKHPEPSVETAVLVRLRHNYDDLCHALEPFNDHLTAIMPCSILELEHHTSEMIGELYGLLEHDLASMKTSKVFGYKNDRVIRTSQAGIKIISAMEQLDGTLIWHINSVIQ